MLIFGGTQLKIDWSPNLTKGHFAPKIGFLSSNDKWSPKSIQVPSETLSPPKMLYIETECFQMNPNGLGVSFVIFNLIEEPDSIRKPNFGSLSLIYDGAQQSIVFTLPLDCANIAKHRFEKRKSKKR